MSAFTRRSFIGTAAAAVGSVAALQKVVGADRSKNDLWFFPPGLPHSILGLNPDGCEFMLVFDDGNFSESDTVLLSDTIVHLPPEVFAKNFAVSQEAFKNVPKEELFIFQADVPGSLAVYQKVAAGARGK